jgi:zinc D-Ala-D-Ala carboxypeptidase
MKLSEHFTLAELTRSDTAARYGIDNAPSAQVIDALSALCATMLEPIRANFKRSVRVTSGYRSPELNKRIGGNPVGSHPLGEAADFEIDGIDNLTAAEWIANSALPFDQLILEFYIKGDPRSGWIHVSHKANKPNRRSVLTAYRAGGKTVYQKGLPK